jgi:bis(5'-nucleosyl)-tetraphosphatase (symmetrical)
LRMATYAIGDVQGCYDELSRLLDALRIEPGRDELWFVGDLVNRGPKSADVLRLVRSLGPAAVVVLGNHDLHLLAYAHGGPLRRGDEGLRPVLEATDGPALVDWLAQQHLAYYRPELNTLMVHAGVAPAWDPLQTVKLAREVEQVLRGPQRAAFLAQMYGNEPDAWSPALQGTDRARFIVNCLTRVRYCHPDGRLDFRDHGPLGTQAPGLVPWFELPGRASHAVRIVFGHWSSLGLFQQRNLLGLDTGCVWGRTLTAARLDGPTRIVAVPSTAPPAAGD